MKKNFNPFNSYFLLCLYREPKKVKFSKHNEIHYINTLEEIKEYLPDLYWKYDKPPDPYYHNYQDQQQPHQILELELELVYDVYNTKKIYNPLPPPPPSPHHPSRPISTPILIPSIKKQQHHQQFKSYFF